MSNVEKIKYGKANSIKEAFEKIKSNNDESESTYWLINNVWCFRIGGTNGIGLSILNEEEKVKSLNKLIKNEKN